MASNKNLLQVDWATIPAPVDDGQAKHLIGMHLPKLKLMSTSSKQINLSEIKGYSVIFIYPRTGQPGKPSLVADWDNIPGARGCTPQACCFRDNFEYFQKHEISVFGLSTQDDRYQQEAVKRLQLPYPLLSDAELKLTNAMQLPTLQLGKITLLKRMALIIFDGIIKHVLYPVFPPDQNATQVIAWFDEQFT